MLELIRGISSPALRKEFLKQREPSLEDLIQIAKNWQRSTDVTKNMEEATVDSRKASSSNYQKGKKEDWKAKSGNKSGGKPAQDGSGDLCMRCGQPFHENRDLCKGKYATCTKCGKAIWDRFAKATPRLATAKTATLSLDASRSAVKSLPRSLTTVTPSP